MRLAWALLAFLESTSALDAYAAVTLKQNCAQPQVGCEGYYRAFDVTSSPANSVFEPSSNVTGIAVAAVGAQATSTGAVVKAKLDVAGFRFKTPADVSDGTNSGLTFYFGYLGVTGTWDNSVKTGAAAGALAEVMSTLSSINVFYDNDNVTGFKWDITQPDATKRYDIFDCAASERLGYDSLDVAGSIDLKSLTWTPISQTTVKCQNITGLSDAPDDCEIHSLTTTGSLNGVSIISFTSRIASRPIKINGVLHGPDFAKFDVNVTYPWATTTGLYAPAKAKLALISFNAGKSGTFVAAAKRNNDDNSDSLVFATQGSTASSYYAYTDTAQIDGASGPVTTQVITGQQIIDFNCTGAPCGLSLRTIAVAVSLKVSVAWVKAFGWTSSITFHALGDKFQPTNVFWDPQVGSTTSDDIANSAVFVAPSLLFLLALLLQ